MIRWLNEGIDWVSASSRTMELSEWIKILVVVVGAPWALVTFRRNNRIKAAELFLKLEDECHQCLPTLLKLESLDDYKETYKAALAKSIPSGPRQYTRPQSNAIDEVEKVLRHFHACYHVRRLGVDAGALDRTYSYYLKMCVSDQRSELRDYLKHFWPNVFFWAQCIGEPWPKRVYIRAKQAWPRTHVWWRGLHP
jgi:hypothetical protein